MKRLIVVCFMASFLSFPAFSALELNIASEFNDKVDISKVVVREGEQTALKFGNVKIFVTASLLKMDEKRLVPGVLLKFKIFRNKRLVSAPTISTLLGRKAKVTQADERGRNGFSLSVIPKKI